MKHAIFPFPVYLCVMVCKEQAEHSGGEIVFPLCFVSAGCGKEDGCFVFEEFSCDGEPAGSGDEEDFFGEVSKGEGEAFFFPEVFGDFEFEADPVISICKDGEEAFEEGSIETEFFFFESPEVFFQMLAEGLISKRFFRSEGGEVFPEGQEEGFRISCVFRHFEEGVEAESGFFFFFPFTVIFVEDDLSFVKGPAQEESEGIAFDSFEPVHFGEEQAPAGQVVYFQSKNPENRQAQELPESGCFRETETEEVQEEGTDQGQEKDAQAEYDGGIPGIVDNDASSRKGEEMEEQISGQGMEEKGIEDVHAQDEKVTEYFMGNEDEIGQEEGQTRQNGPPGDESGVVIFREIHHIKGADHGFHTENEGVYMEEDKFFLLRKEPVKGQVPEVGIHRRAGHDEERHGADVGGVHFHHFPGNRKNLSSGKGFQVSMRKPIPRGRDIPTFLFFILYYIPVVCGVEI